MPAIRIVIAAAAFAALAAPSSAQSERASVILGGVPETAEDVQALDRREGPDQLAMQLLSIAGREDLLAEHHARPVRNACPEGSIIPGNPIDILVEQARGAQIVIVNEAHDESRHRHFITELGLRLAAEGYTHFAAETFSETAAVLMQEEFIPESVGYYTAEALFARQLMALRAVGFDFAAYEIRMDQRDADLESWIEGIEQREEAQADNLIEAVLANHPGARLLIHVGQSHVHERPIPLGEGEMLWFAGRLSEKTGIDPLTISQTHCTSPGAAPALFTEGPSESLTAATDYFVGHPPVSYTDRRPDWRRVADDRDVPIPAELLPEDRAVLVEARALQALSSSLPVERLLVYPGEEIPLLLPPGEWRLEAFTREGRYGAAVDVTVEP